MKSQRLFYNHPLFYSPPAMLLMSALLLLSVLAYVAWDSGDVGLWGLVAVLTTPFAILLYKGIRYQHSSLKMRKTYLALYEQAMHSFEQIPSLAVDNGKAAELKARLKQLGDIHLGQLVLSLYDSPQPHFNVGLLAPQQFHLVFTSATLAHFSVDELARLANETIVFHDLGGVGLYNPPEDPSPTNLVVPMDEETPLWLAILLYVRALSLLKKGDKLLKLRRRGSFRQRAGELHHQLQQENRNWLRASKT